MTVTGSKTSLGIVGLGAYLPGEPVPNDSIAEGAGVELQWIHDRIGIEYRHHAAPEETTADLAVRAAERAAEGSPVTPDMIVLATFTADRQCPATAPFVQERLGLTGVPAFDVDAACSGFVYALATATGLVHSGVSQTPLVIGADVFTRFINPQDRRTAPLFGDGAGAVQLGPVPEGYGILATELWAEGTQTSLAAVPRGGNWFVMDGRGVAGVVMEMGPKLLNTALAKAGVRLDQLNRVVVHQANPRLVRNLSEYVGLADEVMPTYGKRTGNTASASVPVTLALAHEERPFRDGDLIALVAVGAGMTAGAVVLRWYEGPRA
ncbi:3-oxoacyl-ACP synthase III family protein [Streptomyces litchfieldiae]|uniref:3-oxoacyl-ACP synthase III family protein n=1 Tax=Streptomyces litchfieldiae TaxID=3075543 RepID=A0ABU2MXS1_9ACTN|nr:3-oxoacyl-ACP synthase III family protein [Streptomyces sp. DSM 44938]MDT0345824.1 3-oxoacyl-ACP synthase III family protein [Streptomyces sp. DSM 44938]